MTRYPFFKACFAGGFLQQSTREVHLDLSVDSIPAFAAIMEFLEEDEYQTRALEGPLEETLFHSMVFAMADRLCLDGVAQYAVQQIKSLTWAVDTMWPADVVCNIVATVYGSTVVDHGGDETLSTVVQFPRHKVLRARVARLCVSQIEADADKDEFLAIMKEFPDTLEEVVACAG